MKPKVATAFSGGGLSAYALKNIGCELQFAIEYDPEIAEVYRSNHGDRILVSKIEEVDLDRLKFFFPEELDLFQASPSCKRFADVNVFHKPDESDDRAIGGLIAMITTLKPKTIIVENVTQFLGSPPHLWLWSSLSSLYHLSAYTFNSADFGTPQSRTRAFVTGIRRDLTNQPIPIINPRLEHKCWYRAIGDLILSEAVYKNICGEWFKDGKLAPPGNIPPRLGNVILSQQSLLPVAVELVGGKGIYPACQPFHTIRAFGRKNSGQWHRHVIVYPEASVIKMTPRMLARIMGLKDDFILPDRNVLAGEILGNGVAIQVMEAIAQQLLAQINQPCLTY